MDDPTSIDPGALLARTYPLAGGGERVRLRILRRSDGDAVHGLLAGLGLEAEPLALRRALAFDPRVRIALCAVVPGPRGEELRAVGAIALEADAEPDLLVAGGSDPTMLRGLLTDALRARARRRAAA